MKNNQMWIILMVMSFSLSGQQETEAIVDVIGSEEYTRLMSLSLDGFDQSYEGFRMYSDDYDLVQKIIPEYININNLNVYDAALLHWHLGQIHAFNDNYADAISEMKQSSLDSSPIYWKCYVDGTIAFLTQDKEKLEAALTLLEEQDNQMNIEFLEKFLKYFDQSYWDAYNNEY